MSYRFLKIFLTVLLVGCTPLPENPPFEIPAAAIDQAKEEVESDPIFEPSEWVPSNWWTIFDDSQLEDFIFIALSQNPTLQKARDNVMLAHYNANKLRSSLFPTLDWGGDVSRQKFSKTGIIPFNTASNTTGQTTGFAPIAATGGINGIPVYFTQYETELIANYNFDLWGKNRNTYLSGLSEVYANAADEAFSWLELSTSVAQTYLRLQTEYKAREIASAIVASNAKYFDFIEKRLKNNLESAITLNLAESSLAQANITLQQVQANILVDEFQLKAYLAGDFEEEILNTSIDQKPLPAVPLPEQIPLHLVSRRPDITAQIWLIESATRQIKVAKAGFYPDVNLLALFGYQTIHFKKFFEWRSSYYNVDPAFTLPLFEGGRLIANLKESEVNYNIAISRYNELVVNAAKEVLEGITLLSNAHQQYEQLKKIATNEERNFHLMDLRVKNHLNSQLDYVTSELRMLNAKLQEIQGLANVYGAMLALIRALGGGYDACCNQS